MDLKTYIHADRGRASTLASALGISRSYLSQMAGGNAPISPERCVDIERETDAAVTRQELRADWRRIWPELTRVQGAPVAADLARRRKDDQREAQGQQAVGANAGTG